jgi:hypothetical protein
MVKFRNAEEQAAWTMAEALSEKGFAAMRQAEEAAENFRNGKMMTRRQFKLRGLTDVDADIRWAGTTQARKALSDNGWYMSQATMYHDAAAGQYAKALYLRQQDGDPATRDGANSERDDVALPRQNGFSRRENGA